MSVDNADDDQEDQISHSDQFDEQFANIIADIGRPAEDSGFHVGQPTTGHLGVDDEDDLLAHSGELSGLHQNRVCIGMVLAPVSSSQGLHTLLSVAGIREWVVRIKPWTAIWMTVDNAGKMSEEEELASLLGESRSIPSDIDRVARIASRMSQFGAVAMASFLVEGGSDDLEPGVSGQIIARRYVCGEPEDSIPAGVIVGAMPALLESLLLGRTTPDQHDGAVSPDGTIVGPPKGPFGWLRKK